MPLLLLLLLAAWRSSSPERGRGIELSCQGKAQLAVGAPLSASFSQPTQGIKRRGEGGDNPTIPVTGQNRGLGVVGWVSEGALWGRIPPSLCELNLTQTRVTCAPRPTDRRNFTL